MKKNIFWIIALLSAVFYSSAQAQTNSYGAYYAQKSSFGKCFVIGECWEDGKHPNFFELNRFEPALQKFLSPADYQSLVNNKDVTLKLLNLDKEIYIAAGFCPLQPITEGVFGPWNCSRVLLISFTWSNSLEEILDAYNKSSGQNTAGEAVVVGVLGEDEDGGELRLLSVNSPTEAFYWQDGMAEKTLVKLDTDLFNEVGDACSQGPDEPINDCKEGLRKIFMNLQ